MTTYQQFLDNDKPWAIHHGDSILHMADMPAASVDMSVFSPPFPSLYAYTSEAGDIGNSEDLRGEAKLHLSFFFRQFARILKPGRVVVVHVANIPRMKRAGELLDRDKWERGGNSAKATEVLPAAHNHHPAQTL